MRWLAELPKNCCLCVHKSAVATYHNVLGFPVLSVKYWPPNEPDARQNISDYIEECRYQPQNAEKDDKEKQKQYLLTMVFIIFRMDIQTHIVIVTP